MPIKLKSVGGGEITIDAPNTASNYTVTLPASNATVLNSDSTLDATKLSGAVPLASLNNVPGTGAAIFTASGTWSVPSGISSALVCVIAGGGGIIVNATGGAGGSSSFGTSVSATGGGGGNGATTGGQFNGANGTGTVSTGTALRLGSIENITSLFGITGTNIRSGITTVSPYSLTSLYIAGATATVNGYRGGYGGCAAAYVTGLTGTVDITVGTGGTGSNGAGVGGAVIIYW